MQHVIVYDLARGLHVIAVIAWISGLLMLPRFYACITASPHGDDAERTLLDQSANIGGVILAPGLVLSWGSGLFLFASYFAPDGRAPLPELFAAVPTWFWFKLALVSLLTCYHGFLLRQGRLLAAGRRRHRERFWRLMGAAPFLAATAAVLLATLAP